MLIYGPVIHIRDSDRCARSLRSIHDCGWRWPTPGSGIHGRAGHCPILFSMRYICFRDCTSLNPSEEQDCVRGTRWEDARKRENAGGSHHVRASRPMRHERHANVGVTRGRAVTVARGPSVLRWRGVRCWGKGVRQLWPSPKPETIQQVTRHLRNLGVQAAVGWSIPE